MPAKYFKCPDNDTVLIDRCLENGGCRMGNRCATRPYLRLVGYDREWNGVTPSAAGNGPRMLYLKATTDYVINPAERVWAAFGTGTHGKLSIHKYTHNVLSEEKLSDEAIKGIADVLEEDEQRQGFYVLSDYKTWGSFKVAKALGLTIKKTEEPILENGEPVLLKSGKNKGEKKTKTVSSIVIDPSTIDLLSEELQLNRYRILFEEHGFPISKMVIQAIPRDGGTYIAQNRGIDRNLYLIPIRRLVDADVLDFYKLLQISIDRAFRSGFVRRCDKWESWDGRRCNGYCEVATACIKMSEEHKYKSIPF